MFHRIIIVAFACFAVAVAARAQSGAPTKPLLDNVRDARAARLAGNHQAWRDAVSSALELAPDHVDLLISAARAEAGLGNTDAALQRLGDAIRRGAGLDVTQISEFQSLTRLGAFNVLAQRARANAIPVAHATAFAQLRKDSEAEGIAYDPGSHRLFAGSIQGEIFAIDESGKVTTFVAPGSGLREVYGLKVDPVRRLLWAATTVFPNPVQQPGAASKPDLGVSGVFAFNLADGSVAKRVWLDERPQLHGFNDLALAANRDVYITDSSAGAVYVLRDGVESVELFVRDPHLTFANGIVVSPDQRFVVVASIEGLTRIDIATHEMLRLKVPGDASVNSIDGLAFAGSDLIGVQSSPFLARLIRIRLDRKLDAIEAVEVLNSRTPAEFTFTTVTIAGDQLYAVGGTPAADANGRALAAEPNPQIVRVPLGHGRLDFLEDALPW